MFSYEEINDEWSEYCVKNLLEIGINWEYVVNNPNITYKIIKENPDKPCDYYYLGRNPNITWEIVEANSNKPWNYTFLSNHSNITWEIVCKNPDKPWCYYYLSRNRNITCEIVKENLNKRWGHLFAIHNPNITFKFIKKQNRYARGFGLSFNEFILEKYMFFRKYLSEWFKKSDLKKELIENLWHPKNYEKFKYYDPEMFLEEDE